MLNWCGAEELKNYFSSFGVVAECMVKKDPNTGMSRGFGFVSFTDPVSVDHVCRIGSIYNK